MIEKFITIKNVGKFQDYCASRDVSLRKLNLVYAENGRGKTTLCALLRSLQTGSPEPISERKTLAGSGDPSVRILHAGRTLSFANGAWSETVSDLVIFDSEFVHQNVYVGDSVDHEQRKNLYRIIIGAKGVVLATKVETLDGKIREANGDIGKKRGAVEKSVPTGMSLDDFLKVAAVSDVDAKITAKESEITALKNALAKAAEIQSAGQFSKVSLPTLPDEFASTLAKTVENVSEEAETRVKAHIAARMDGRGQTWISQGLTYVKDARCPFCDRIVEGNELVAAYRSYFNQAYNSLKQEVGALPNQAASSLGESRWLGIQKILGDNGSILEFWKQFIELSLPPCSFDGIKEALSRLRDECLALAREKQSNPLDAIQLSDEYYEAVKAIAAVKQVVVAYNAAVEAANAVIAEKKGAASNPTALPGCQRELAALMAAKMRHTPEVATACATYLTAEADKAKLEVSKTAAKDELDQYCADVLEAYQEGINGYLKEFGTGFRIANSRHNYKGGSPSSTYQLAINEQNIDLGTSTASAGSPCFRTALSAGDRSALALAFFLVALDQDEKLSDRIVVLDDPFTSLDRFRRECTAQITAKLANRTKQVLLLSHDAHFLKLVWDKATPADRKALRIARTGRGSFIADLDIARETSPTYLQNHADLLRYYRDFAGDRLAVAKSIRLFLEGLFRSHFPEHFGGNEWLGDFIEKVRNADPSSGLMHAKPDLDELTAVNDYSKRFHHEGGATVVPSDINEDELHNFVGRTLAFAGGT